MVLGRKRTEYMAEAGEIPGLDEYRKAKVPRANKEFLYCMSMTTFDLEKRTETFALNVRIFVRGIPPTLQSTNDIRQLLRSSGSVGANFIEARDSASKKDFYYRLKICRKEAKESRLWLSLLSFGLSPSLENRRKELEKEAQELVLIFASILRKSGAIK